MTLTYQPAEAERPLALAPQVREFSRGDSLVGKHPPRGDPLERMRSIDHFCVQVVFGRLPRQDLPPGNLPLPKLLFSRCRIARN